jgi:hypothetical protein
MFYDENTTYHNINEYSNRIMVVPNIRTLIFGIHFSSGSFPLMNDNSYGKMRVDPKSLNMMGGK